MGAETTLRRARDGHVPSVSQMISLVESGTALPHGLLAEIHAGGGNAQLVGVTGAPGSGKSTLVDALASVLRDRGQRVAVLAVDPSSSLSGGAILGDRIRMHRHTLDPNVYVRSMSSRGALGGVSKATVDSVAVLDMAGYDTVVIETVGAGQAEVDIVRIAHTTLVVSVPGLGDDIQAIKAGLLEVADIHVVNKVDRPEGDRAIKDLVSMLSLSTPAVGAWEVPVLGTVATSGKGVGAVADAAIAHLAWMEESGELRRRQAGAARARIKAIVDTELQSRLASPADEDVATAIAEVVERRIDPHRAARILIDSMTSNQNGGAS